MMFINKIGLLHFVRKFDQENSSSRRSEATVVISSDMRKRLLRPCGLATTKSLSYRTRLKSRMFDMCPTLYNFNHKLTLLKA